MHCRSGGPALTGMTYGPMACGFGYTAFVIGAFAGLIPGWACSLPKHTAFVTSAIRQAARLRARHSHPLACDTIHHSDASSQPGFKGSIPSWARSPMRWTTRWPKLHRVVQHRVRTRWIAVSAWTNRPP